jgi:hypothetical protein
VDTSSSSRSTVAPIACANGASRFGAGSGSSAISARGRTEVSPCTARVNVSGGSTVDGAMPRD